MPDTTDNVLEILNYIRLNESVQTTHEMFNHFKKNNMLKYLIFSFPFIVKGHVLSFEVLLSKKVVEQTYLERPEQFDQDIIQSMIGHE